MLPGASPDKPGQDDFDLTDCENDQGGVKVPADIRCLTLKPGGGPLHVVDERGDTQHGSDSNFRNV